MQDSYKIENHFKLDTTKLLLLEKFGEEKDLLEILTNSHTVYEDSEGQFEGEQIWIGQNDKGFYYFFRNFGSCEGCDPYMKDFNNFEDMNDEEKNKTGFRHLRHYLLLY
ncbi:hypothetical protein Catovirus_1_236 [Catovirus CTV1]|uniref:Uncharacterized protein n=1 Tax=Catovirus CTV1 TaxID=1977631 RepID=A0A1V0S909_9VIRU|nr:hypothetical protein Catovirus_1_236 [Catovirus CTV1]